MIQPVFEKRHLRLGQLLISYTSISMENFFEFCNLANLIRKNILIKVVNFVFKKIKDARAD